MLACQEERDLRQRAILRWACDVFGAACATNRAERIQRFVEEALELAQALDMSRAEAHALVDFVYDRAKGEVHQEVGGVSISLLALCEHLGLSANAEELREYQRILTLDRDKLRAKQMSKQACGVAGVVTD